MTRWYCCRAYSRAARLAARVSSWLLTVACCLAGSISMSTVPAATRWPERTRIWVTSPSTCGMITAESRDFRVATYSVESSTGTTRAVSIFTATAGGAPLPLAPPAQLTPVRTRADRSAVAQFHDGREREQAGASRMNG